MRALRRDLKRAPSGRTQSARFAGTFPIKGKEGTLMTEPVAEADRPLSPNAASHVTSGDNLTSFRAT